VYHIKPIYQNSVFLFTRLNWHSYESSRSPFSLTTQGTLYFSVHNYRHTSISPVSLRFYRINLKLSWTAKRE